MAEFLVIAKGHTNPDPVIDRAGAYKRGDIVDVREDGFDWGRPIRSFWPKFAIIKIPGVTVAQVRKYIQPEIDAIDPTKILTRRLYKVEVNSLPLSIRRALRQSGTVTLDKTTVLSYLRNKTTGALES